MKILFVCTGNTCRSPMAEALLKDKIRNEDLNWEVQSAGLAAMDGGKISRNAVKALQDKGIDFTFISQMVKEELLMWADLIVTMTYGHKQVIMELAPDMVEQIMTLKEIANRDSKRDELEQEIDQFYLHLEEKRAEWQAKFKIKTNDKLSDEAKEAWETDLEPLLEKEKSLRNKWDKVNLNPDIIDPFGGSLEDYLACRDELESEINKWILQQKKEKDSTNDAEGGSTS